MSNADIGYGTVVKFSEDPAPTVTTMLTVAEVTSFKPPESSVSEVEVTHMASPDRRREFIPGMTDSGTAAMTMNYIPASATDVALEAWRASGEVRVVTADYPNGATVTFTAFVLSYSPDDIPVDGKMTATCELKVTGAVTITA